MPLDRTTLRGPFFAQCYLAAPFALAVSVSGVFVRLPHHTTQYAGLALLALGPAWYVGVETLWFARHLELGRGRAFGVALGSFLRAALYSSLLGASLILVIV
jgi:hypothetical protein